MASEIDKFARKAYETVFGIEPWGDVTKIDASDVPDHDLLTAGFPCQAFSVAGKRLGFEDTRGTLFFEVARIAKHKQPRIILLENVKGLIGHDKGRTLETIVRTLNEIGYVVDFEVLNSKYFGVPQNRERIFIVALREDIVAAEPWNVPKERKDVVAKAKRRLAEIDGVKTFNFDWPKQTEVTTKLRDILESAVDEKYYLNNEKTSKLITKLQANPKVENIPIEGVGRLAGWRNREDRVFAYQSDKKRSTAQEYIYLKDEAIADSVTVGHMPKYFEQIAVPCVNDRGFLKTNIDGISTTVDANYAKGLDNHGQRTHVIISDAELFLKQYDVIQKTYGASTILKHNETGTLQAARVDKVPHVVTKYRIRKLTPRECFRLQGFPDEVHDAIERAGISDSQRYKMAGNAVTVNVVEAIAVRLLPILEHSEKRELVLAY